MKLLTRPEEFVMLAIWQLQDQAYSLPIREHVSKSTEQEWSLSSIYTPLNRLTRKQLLSSYMTDPLPERGGRPRRIYELTPAGKKALIHIRKIEQAVWLNVTGLTIQESY